MRFPLGEAQKGLPFFAREKERAEIGLTGRLSGYAGAIDRNRI